MTYQEFKDTILMKVTTALPSNTQIQLRKLLKNNNLQLDGLVISEDECNIAPTIYLNYYYEKYLEGTSIEDVTAEIMQCYLQHRVENDIDTSFFTDYECAKHNIIYKLINYEKNKELLSTIPYIPYLDLAIVFCCIVDITDEGNSSILIHNDHLIYWNVSPDELLALATINTPRLLHYELKDMRDIIEELLPLEADELLDDTGLESSSGMFVLTNHQRLNGACCILYQNLLQEFSHKINSDLFILPSSVHEVLLIPATLASSRQELSDMVHDVNTTKVAEEEILSDHVYYYSQALNAVSM